MPQRKTRTARALLLAAVIAATPVAAAGSHAHAAPPRPTAYTGCQHVTYGYWNGVQTVWATKADCTGWAPGMHGYKAWQLCQNGSHGGYQYGDTEYPGTYSYTNVPNPPCGGTVTAAGIIQL